MHRKTWVISLLCLSAFWLSLVALFNYKVDSVGLFGTSNDLVNAAENLANGHMIAGQGDFDERIFQTLIIKFNNTKIDTVVIGSSNALKIRKRFVENENRTYFNHSVSGVALEDYIAILGAYKRIRGYLPSKVILGIVPWIFDKSSGGGQGRWKSIREYFDYMIKEIAGKGAYDFSGQVEDTKWVQLFSIGYTKANIKFLKRLFKGNSSFYITDTIDVDDYVREVDGSLHYPLKSRNPSQEKVTNLAIRDAEPPVSHLDRFQKIDETTVRLFTMFVDYLQKNGTKVVFFIPPYHPISYRMLSEHPQYRIINDVEEHLMILAEKKQIALVGSFNPEVYGFTGENFMDGSHGYEIVPQRIFAQKSRSSEPF